MSKVMWNVTIGALAVVLSLQLATRIRARSSEPLTVTMSPPVGAHLETPVTRSTTGDTVRLADVASGNCRYVVVALRTCAACSALADSWEHDLDGVDSSKVLPPGWSAVWLFLDKSSDSTFTQHPTAVPHYQVLASLDSAANALGVRSVPAHLVLDQEGSVVSGGPGAPLWKRDAYKEDCTVDKPTEEGRP